MGMPDPYATPADYYVWLGEAAPSTGAVSPADLERAQARVDEMLVGVAYPVDAGENPTNPVHARALKNATCAQARWFEETGDTSGVLAVLGGSSIGTVKLAAPTTGAGGKGETVDLRYSSEAATYLAAAGLAHKTVRTYS